MRSGFPYKKRGFGKPKVSASYRKSRSFKSKVKSVILNTSEHKCRDVLMNGIALNGGSYIAMNPLYWIPQDGSIFGRTGAKIQNVNLHLRGRYKHLGIQNTVPSTYPWESSTLRIIVFQHDKEWRNTAENTFSDITTGGVGTNLTNGEIFLGANSNNIDYAFPNLKECRILYDKKVYTGYRSTHRTDEAVPVNSPNQAGSRSFYCKIPLGNIFYQGGSGLSLTKLKQTYVLFVAGCPTPIPAGSDSVGSIDVNYILTFSDF